MERVNGWCSCEDRSASQIWLGSSENEDKEHALEVDCDRYDAVWSIGACPGQAPRSDGRWELAGAGARALLWHAGCAQRTKLIARVKKYRLTLYYAL